MDSEWFIDYLGPHVSRIYRPSLLSAHRVRGGASQQHNGAMSSEKEDENGDQVRGQAFVLGNVVIGIDNFTEIARVLRPCVSVILLRPGATLRASASAGFAWRTVLTSP